MASAAATIRPKLPSMATPEGRSRLSLVSGHGFSHAASRQMEAGFSPCPSAAKAVRSGRGNGTTEHRSPIGGLSARIFRTADSASLARVHHFLYRYSMPEINSKAPDFTLPDENGNPVSLDQFRGHNVVLFFYPKANTPG
jgi:hypothetical protein